VSDNADMVRRIHEAVERGEDPLELGLLAPDFEYVSPPDAMEPGIRRGEEGLRHVLQTLDDTYAERRFDVERILEAGERVVVLGRITMQGRSSGVALQGEGASDLDAARWVGGAHRVVPDPGRGPARRGPRARPIATRERKAGAMDFKLELVAVPVSDVDRAKAFYTEQAGFNADHDHVVSDDLRFVQLTPPGSACSIAIGKGVSDAEPGSVKGLQMVVSDIHAAREELAGRGLEVGEVQEFPWGSFVFFSDPDGNGWAVQQIPDRS
jgi:ketosteroid isomerase-like protein/catechol 2,3-dioxygenase-like lactoylglutathione lyase family enzyme